jgi:hypothetical protein
VEKDVLSHMVQFSPWQEWHVAMSVGFGINFSHKIEAERLGSKHNENPLFSLASIETSIDPIFKVNSI